MDEQDEQDEQDEPGEPGEPTTRKSYQYKLKPTPQQTQMLDRTLMLCRHVYNAAISERREAWRMRGVSLTYYQQKAKLPGLKEAMREYSAVHSQVLQDVVLRVDRAFQAFFRRVKAGETPGYPRFHGRDRFNSFTYPQYDNGARLESGCLVLSKIGRVAVHWSRPLAGTPKTVTISREADGWYVCISCAEVPIQPLAPTGQETGIDLGLESFATLADGTMIHNPRCYRTVERRLKTAQRKVSRRTKGSSRRRKAVKLLAKAHLKVKRQRQDFQHKTALHLVRQFDTIYHEDLQVANLVKNHHLAKSISDAGWSAFLTILAFKAACAGKRVIAVNPAYTSQTCSGCGVIVKKGLSVRWHRCPNCGTSLHRDHNAAKNIERLGQSLRGAVA
ncbi:MAG TPA: transposase [Ktedonobacterales bacterium]|nr:transposase [Ktedonobacterales bacterium]